MSELSRSDEAQWVLLTEQELSAQLKCTLPCLRSFYVFAK